MYFRISQMVKGLNKIKNDLSINGVGSSDGEVRGRPGIIFSYQDQQLFMSFIEYLKFRERDPAFGSWKVVDLIERKFKIHDLTVKVGF